MDDQNATEMKVEVRKWVMTELDREVLRKVKECCSKDRQRPYKRFKPRSIKDMGYLVDENIKCHLFCNQELLEKGIIRLVENQERTDVQVNVRGYIFNCHMAILHVSTEYFKRLNSMDCVIINARDVTVDGFAKAYEWMIKADTVPQREHIIELFMTAKFLGMPELIKQLWFCFEDSNQFSEGQAFKLYIETVPYQEITLQQLLLTRVSYFFLSAISTLEFLQLNAQQVHDMLDSNVAAINNEFEILMCALRWMKCNWAERKQHIELLMSAVRFGLMPPWCLLSLKIKQQEPEMQEICEHPSVSQRINDGLSYSVTQESLNEQSLEIRLGSQREWIIDEEAAHHHEYKCPNWKSLDYDKFSTFIDRIINVGPSYCKSLKPKTTANLMSCCRAAIADAKNCIE